MNKEHLVHLHSLLASVKDEFEERGTDIPAEEYESLGVSPVGIHQSKEDQREAILTLGEEITDALDEHQIAEITA